MFKFFVIVLLLIIAIAVAPWFFLAVGIAGVVTPGYIWLGLLIGGVVLWLVLTSPKPKKHDAEDKAE